MIIFFMMMFRKWNMLYLKKWLYLNSIESQCDLEISNCTFHYSEKATISEIDRIKLKNENIFRFKFSFKAISKSVSRQIKSKNILNFENESINFREKCITKGEFVQYVNDKTTYLQNWKILSTVNYKVLCKYSQINWHTYMKISNSFINKLDAENLISVIKNLCSIKTISLSIDQASTAIYFLSNYCKTSFSLQSVFIKLCQKPTISEYLDIDEIIDDLNDLGKRVKIKYPSSSF